MLGGAKIGGFGGRSVVREASRSLIDRSKILAPMVTSCYPRCAGYGEEELVDQYNVMLRI